MECCDSGCYGALDETITRSINTPCAGKLILYPCGICGLLHWKHSGMEVYNRLIKSRIFLKKGVTVDESGAEVSL